ncbi:MAG TPA: ABC transporter permease subunit [Mycobacteriales bacterium]|nr:ABC transporter permease subunit [Mycobacteriales bacterium]
MTWMTWRQMRAGSLAALAVVAAAAITLTITGVHLSSLYSGYLSCSGFTCNAKLDDIGRSYRHIKLIGTALIAVPVVLGVFWGAPLVAREIESGTYRLAWVQGVSRTRWMASKLAVTGAATALVAGALTFAFTWWAIPFDRIEANRIDPSIFADRGIVPVAYALFAVALGVAAGTIIRRTLPAMAVTLVGFIAVRMVIQFYVRAHLIAPVHRVFALTQRFGLGIERSPSGIQLQAGTPEFHGAWVTSSHLVDSAGHAPTSAFINQACRAVLDVAPPSGPPQKGGAPSGPAIQAFQTCLSNVGARYHQVVSYQPASRFWELQWLESAIFLGLAAVLIGLSIYWVRRRLV